MQPGQLCAPSFYERQKEGVFVSGEKPQVRIGRKGE
jgi:hypothetical protein